MCTIILAHRCWRTTPLLIAANRDEQVSRPSRSPERWASGILAPVDEQAGGTWLGHNASGVVAAVTNRFGAPPDARKRSRGELVPRALTAASAEEAARLFQPQDGAAYNPFNMLIADIETAWLVRSESERVHAQRLTRGVHVVTERSGLAFRSEREVSLREVVGQWKGERSPTDAHLIDVLGRHHDEPFDGHCVHLPELNYATRSSSLLRADAYGALTWQFADGPPCTAPFVTVRGPT
ncbi:MAG: NRDE family protein [Myxococcota bacterium]